MAEHAITLTDGITIGEDTHRLVTLRELTAADIFAAQEAAERLVYSPNPDTGEPEPQLVSSPARFGQELLRRQIVSIGDIRKVDADILGRLSSLDLATIESGVAALEQAGIDAVKRSTERGRVPAPGDDAGNGNAPAGHTGATTPQ